MVRAIHRKLLRDLWEMRGQALAIALVIVSGVSTYVMSLSTLGSLERTRDTYYSESRFADVFADLKRAPESVRRQIASLPGVAVAETRVVGALKIEFEDFPEPVTGTIVSLPDDGTPLLNRLHLIAGRAPQLAREDEVAVSEAFAEAHRLVPGDTLRVTMNGNRRVLRIVGTALSAEYIYQLSPGALIPDFERYGILWMARTTLEGAFDLEEAFNNVVITLDGTLSADDVIERLDLVLAPYGGLGAIARVDQISNRFLSEDLRQLRGMATIFPAIFLSVAAFLLNVVISRLVHTQREQIAALKAFGYSNFSVGVHFMQMIIVIVVVGAAGGIAGGVWLGVFMSRLYTGFYRFPYLEYVFEPRVALTAVLVSLAAATAGTLHAVRRAALLPPAEAMRPEPPARYRESLVEKLGLRRLFSEPSRMIVRNLERRPIKSAFSMLGIGFSIAILMVGRFQQDAVEHLVNVQFSLAQREDLSVMFVEPTSYRAVHELQGLRGVEQVEVFRAVSVRLRHENRSYRAAITGIEPQSDLHRLIDTKLRAVPIPAAGIVLTDHLADILAVEKGETVIVEVLEGRRRTLEVPVARLVRQYIGVAAYMDLAALQDLLGEGDAISGVYLAAEARRHDEIFAELEEMPRVAGTTVRMHAIDSFYDTMAETMLVFTFINLLLAATIACGVVYNSARISLSERSRELASLRVLGLTRGEISYILLGELALLTLLAIPIGFLVGRGLCVLITNQVQNDLYRIPLVVEPSTYSFAATVVLVASALSGLFVRRKLDTLDLVAVLKTRE